MYSMERVYLPCVETTREAFLFVTPTGDSPRDPQVSLTGVAGRWRMVAAGCPTTCLGIRGGTRNLQYHVQTKSPLVFPVALGRLRLSGAVVFFFSAWALAGLLALPVQ